jgi:hypothetical protein
MVIESELAIQGPDGMYPLLASQTTSSALALTCLLQANNHEVMASDPRHSLKKRI